MESEHAPGESVSEPGLNRPYLRFRYAVNTKKSSYVTAELHISDTVTLSCN